MYFFPLLFLLFTSPILTNDVTIVSKPKSKNFWEIYKIDVSKISKAKLEKIKLVFEFIETLPTDKKYLSEKFYKRNSKFEKYFGFSFNGINLNHWILSRIQKIKIQKINDYLALNTGTEIILSESFFDLSVLEQSIILIHEARHSDGIIFSHLPCPKDFPYLSPRNPEANLSDLEACDDRGDGSYGFSAAYLFELICYYPTDREMLIGKYNSELLRIISKNE